MTLPSKKVSDSAIHDYAHRVFSNDLNSQNNVFGGLVMSTLDRIALVVAERHSGKTCVTASVDALHFLQPASMGENLIFQASVNRTWRTSMEVGLKVLAENPKIGTKKHIVSAYFTFVGLDENGQPTEIPAVTPETRLEQRRYAEAQIRREQRFAMAEQRKRLREDSH